MNSVYCHSQETSIDPLLPVCLSQCLKQSSATSWFYLFFSFFYKMCAFMSLLYIFNHQWITHQRLHWDVLPRRWDSSHHNTKWHSKYLHSDASFSSPDVKSHESVFSKPHINGFIMITRPNSISVFDRVNEEIEKLVWIFLITQSCLYQDHCYYHGRIVNDSESSVSISTCDGLRWALKPL